MRLEPFIFQYGMHPYVNMGLNLLLGGLLFIKWIWRSNHLYTQSRFFRFLLFLTCLYLIFVTLLQSFFVNSNESLVLQMGATAMAVFTVYLFGRVIPTTLKPESFLRVLKSLAVFFCIISFALLFISPGTSFKGARFIGVFKHIPHMVSCATLACFAIYYSLFCQRMSRLRTALNYFYLLICFGLLILTGTRSALAAVLLGFIMCLFLFKASSWANRFLKASLTLAGLLIVLFFGHDITDYAVGVVRGKQAIANRAAQDGFRSRLEEIERGYILFEKQEWLGQGLLMKFSNGQETEVSRYDANKDPHNIFVSAGVLGGWGFVFITLIAMSALFFASLKSLFSKNNALRLLAIYMIINIPILMIYHIHLSIGGIADRIYWIVIGYLAVKEMDLKVDETS